MDLCGKSVFVKQQQALGNGIDQTGWSVFKGTFVLFSVAAGPIYIQINSI